MKKILKLLALVGCIGCALTGCTLDVSQKLSLVANGKELEGTFMPNMTPATFDRNDYSMYQLMVVDGKKTVKYVGTYYRDYGRSYYLIGNLSKRDIDDYSDWQRTPKGNIITPEKAGIDLDSINVHDVFIDTDSKYIMVVDDVLSDKLLVVVPYSHIDYNNDIFNFGR